MDACSLPSNCFFAYEFLYPRLDRINPCKGMQDSLEFWIPRHEFGIPDTGFEVVVSGTWIRIIIVDRILDSLS